MPATPAWPPESLPRLFIDTPLTEGVEIDLDKPQAHYVGTVMRRQPGDALLLFDGAHGEWRGEIIETGKKRVRLRVTAQTRPQEAASGLTLAFAPIKKQRIDFLVEKAVELGVERLQPVLTQRTIAARVGEDRIRAHIVEAAEQCGRTALATLLPPVRLKRWLLERERTPLYFADEEGGAPALASFAPPPATILVGPEGGFTPEERAMIRAEEGAIAISLGPRILRAETAALAAIAAYMASAGDWSV
ncbi:16S rRNA (uracil(1498)-N(3))-methyltransferase [Sphingomicrobium astaxanthinifaciens]|uniref:16S rRNA (uracil(1498)-N(3))-methyltransferase n=1 Tax=Sphingomicrobium astaxanthinifaciens TaxID=1227949 RepID=UPI001FCC9B80|nr:16S rRNA (uracil(1498)-N(3))-methyltransferase [Sphingomicrobium astaxanthinifaciens]MCJ7421573.1 16S rRNA (uracil(1498)-N(3))-methyltransferase [Sphingomicrobium astaxanthinifaciens]